MSQNEHWKFPKSVQHKINDTCDRIFEEFKIKNGGVCKYFLQNQCFLGSKCTLRHERNEKTVVCKLWLKGVCKKDMSCEFLHIYCPSRMPSCSAFLSTGECRNPDCLFIHDQHSARSLDCFWYNRGFCKHGPNCKNKHIRKEICELYMAGFCPSGLDCKKGHPKFELPQTAVNIGKNTKGNSFPPFFCLKCRSIGHSIQNCDNTIDIESVLNRHKDN